MLDCELDEAEKSLQYQEKLDAAAKVITTLRDLHLSGASHITAGEYRDIVARLGVRLCDARRIWRPDNRPATRHRRGTKRGMETPFSRLDWGEDEDGNPLTFEDRLAADPSQDWSPSARETVSVDPALRGD